ncbi:hypothetical protein F2P81_009262 [Scophthalmus maximus]|uniref:Uncharacterized protein n=1 Tax=Scophthalmus maximus TaxID=52904 RepID=A0A6A4T360_SCOMX|nr:hypothetical protein F2P81_009262 [Scophthalmus maximus]
MPGAACDANTCRKPTQWGRRSSVALTTSTMAAREDSWTWGVDKGSLRTQKCNYLCRKRKGNCPRKKNDGISRSRD